uniref:F-box domain-containing protein n=1 Tax=Talaromyces marneffei PM1 TaxID=1077442 RepID=A0A093XY70_TALMA
MPLLSLNLDVLLMIFGSLSDLDDPISLANTCRRLLSIFQNNKRHIGWSIMHCSEYHKYDAALYQLLNYMHNNETDVTLKTPLSHGTRSPPSHILEDYSKFYLDYSEINKDLYYKRVILWWNKSKALHDIYIKNDVYMATLSFNSEYVTFERGYWTALSLYNQAKIPDEFASSLPKGERLRHISKGRFYRAVIGRFIDAKALQFSRLFPDYEKSGQWEDNIAATWSNHLRSFREALEMLEIVDFAYFLLSNILKVGRIPEEPDIPEPLFHWAIAIEQLQSALTPFDILALLTCPLQLSESRYLSELYRDRSRPGMCKAEDDVAHKLKLEKSSTQWSLYRASHWRVAIRGRCFSDSFDEKRIAHDIRQFELDDQYRRPEGARGAWEVQPGLRYWWEDLYHSSNHEDAALSISFPEAWVIEGGSSQAEIFATLNAFKEYHVV